MTRLREDDIVNISSQLKEYDNQLLLKVGKTLAGIAAHAIGRTEKEIYISHEDIVAAVVPMSCGEGIINGFSQTVQKIIEFMGFASFVTGSSDVGGLAEAVSRGAKVIFLGDDDNFIAVNTSKGKIVDNGIATGRGYGAALDLMAGGIQGKEVLLMGAGPVGTGAAEFMASRGARVLIYDIDINKAERLKEAGFAAQTVNELDEALESCNLVLDATPAAGIIGKEFITQSTMICAPGIPLGLCDECIPLVSGRLVHDALEIGVATMLFEAVV